MRQTTLSLLLQLYTGLLRFYPSGFREEFGEEMAAVFQEQMEEAAADGRIALLQACWREGRDWPVHCFQTHWQARQQRTALLAAGQPGWWDAAVAGFPYLLFALVISGSTMLFLFGRSTGGLVSLLFGFGFVFVLLVVLVTAWWRGWPVWSAAWLGFLFFFLLVLLVPGQLSYLVDSSPGLRPVWYLTSELGLPLLWFAVLYLLMVRWPRYGLVAMLPVFGITWFLYLEFVPEGVSLILTAVIWVWLGLVAIVLMRWQYHKWDVWLLYLAGLVVGIIFIVAAHFLTEMQVRDRTVASMGEDLLSELVPALIPLAGILILSTLSWWSRLNNRYAVRCFRLLLAGVVLSAIGLQSSLMTSRTLAFSWPENLSFWSTAFLLLGCSLMVMSVWLLIRNRRKWLPPVSWPLVGLLLFLPLLVNIRWLNIAYGPGPVWLIGRLAAILWLVVAAWQIGSVRDQLPPVPATTKASTTATIQSEQSGTSGGYIPITRGQWLLLVLGLALLVVLLLPATTVAVLFPNNQTQPFDSPTSLPLFVLMTTGLIMAAGLLSSGFNLLQSGRRRAAVFFLILTFLLLTATLRNYYWLAIWDSTYDGLGILWLFFPVMGIFIATFLLVVTLPRRSRWAAVLYLILLPPALLITARLTENVDFRQLTERRAERVSQALQTYYDREGHYPDDLSQLTPRYLLSVSEPMIIFDQEWCYEGGGQQYEFGYVFREHWSNPNLVGYVYSETDSADEDWTFPPLCQAKIAGLRARDPSYYTSRKE